MSRRTASSSKPRCNASDLSSGTPFWHMSVALSRRSAKAAGSARSTQSSTVSTRTSPRPLNWQHPACTCTGRETTYLAEEPGIRGRCEDGAAQICSRIVFGGLRLYSRITAPACGARSSGAVMESASHGATHRPACGSRGSHRQKQRAELQSRHWEPCTHAERGAGEVSQRLKPKRRHRVVHQHLVPHGVLRVTAVEVGGGQPELSSIWRRTKGAVHVHGHARSHLADGKVAEGTPLDVARGKRQCEADSRHVVAPLFQCPEHRRRDEVKAFDDEPIVRRRRLSWPRQRDAHHCLLLGRELGARARAQAKDVIAQRRVRVLHMLRQRGRQNRARLPSYVLLGRLGHHLRLRCAAAPPIDRDVRHAVQEEQQPRRRLCPVREELLCASRRYLGPERGAALR
eukprot:5210612-Prymnesium_polylepis.2